ncbi:hypothetical protein GCM10007086_13100 [Photobacterium aphoticum]|uniref:AB hydrolase-1 domain-containing protein n=2 Tax=Photobacterium aphoticum TaxID=754436 RepID=A0A0J1JE19_9GAMM|nr:hypothetical protein ABT58_15645 [Photobacterium aphoticum]GHA40849.1 hypothetical protein GCM10007086_13100 [Photobacterium aphoticum]
MRSVKRTVKWVVGVIVLGMAAYVALVVWQGSQAKAAIKQSNTPLGQWVDVGGFNMHLHCLGTGSPTVILEAGAGDFSVIWEKVHGVLSTTTQVCAYDRSGLGWSEINPEEEAVVRVETRVEELTTLLNAANVAPPYIMVGHSFGGLLAQAYVQTHREDVAGLVLIDALHAEQSEDLRAIHQKKMQQAAEEYQVVSVMQKIGLLALSPNEIPNPGLSEEGVAKYRGVLASLPHVESMLLELNSIPDNLMERRNPSAGDGASMPTALIYATSHQDAGLSAQENATFATQWVALQRQVAAQSSNTVVLADEQSGHYIQLDNPDLVNRTILDMVNTLR